ncbi:MAG: DinB family protein [Anaerolineae bacterium]|nr:DinB family protein [Anaerolineae bacterium]
MTNHEAMLPLDRRRLFARLASARANLLLQLIGLDEEKLTGGSVFDDWSPADLLGHVQAWDEIYAERFALALAGRDAEIPGVDMEVLAAHNEALRLERRAWSIEQLVSAAADSRSQVLDLLGRFSDDGLQRELELTWGNPTVLDWAERRQQHDTSHAADIERWRLAAEISPAAGPKAILLAALNTSRAALMAAVELIPPDERSTRPVAGDWTLKDVVGHVVDWEWWIADALRFISAGQAPQVESYETIEAWNQQHAAARQAEPWGAVWSDFRAARDALMGALAGISQDALAVRYPAPDAESRSAYGWACIALEHDLEHAHGLLGEGGGENE